MIELTTTAAVKCDADLKTIPAGERVYVVERAVSIQLVTASGLSIEKSLPDREELCSAHFVTKYPELAAKLGI